MSFTFVLRVHVDRLLDLRHRVLRAGLPAESARFDGDDEPDTIHLAAIEHATDRIVGCCTLLRRPWTDGSAAWQLRGMAVEPDRQRAGVGAMLLRATDELVVAKPPLSTSADGAALPDGVLLWCNARVPAARFYERHGWRIASDAFDIPTAGPHVRMTKRIVVASVLITQ